MRSLVRTVAPVLAAVVIVLAGSSSALASSRAPRTWSPPPVSAPSGTDASPGWAVNDAWCNGDDAFMTCFVVTGRIQMLMRQGVNAVVINVRTDATHYEQAVAVAQDTEFSHERFAVNGNGTYTVHFVTHTRVTDGDGSCSYQEVFRIVDFDLVTEHDASSCD